MSNHKHPGIIAPLGVLLIVAAAVTSLWQRPISLRGAATGDQVALGRTGTVIAIRDAKGRAKGFAHTDLSGIEGLFDALERYGAPVTMHAEEKKGISSLHVTIDGKKIGPIVTACPQCEPIVFEY